MQAGTAMAPIKSLRNLVTTDPFYLLQNRLNRLFDFPFAPFAEETLPLTNWVPTCDIYETGKEIVVKAEHRIESRLTAGAELGPAMNEKYDGIASKLEEDWAL